MASDRAITGKAVSINNHRPQRPVTRRDFEIAVICALPLEADAVDAVFDHHWDDDGPPYDKALGDPNAYSTGTVGRHNVVLAHMPGMGKANAAAVAANIRPSFPNIKLAVIVGVCGCVPLTPDGDEIVLGDVIISDGVVQYDLGRRMPERFVRKDTLLDSLGRPNAEIRGVLAKLKGLRGRKRLQDKMASYLAMIQREPGLAAQYPGAVHDKLFDAAYRHITDGKLCDECGCDGPLMSRTRLGQDNPQAVVHFGLIASGDTVLKSGQDRDAIAREEGVIGFEMEGAGVWDSFPCVVIKGTCDYADSHKTKAWQRYAAATAAACMKVFLESWAPSSSWQPELRAVPESITSLSSRILSIPFLRNRNFIGRDTILEDLKRKLFVEQDCQKLAIVGLGGVGKTQVALQFAYWLRDSQAEYAVFWVSALSRASFEQSYLEIGKKLGVSMNIDEEDPKESVRKHLSSEDTGKWLLIVDNADDQEILLETPGIYDYLPESQTGLMVFTTRSMDIGLSVASSDIIELHEMNEKEAERFLEKSLVRKQLLQEGAMTTELLRELTCLPLAIAQAAAYLNRNRSSIRRYLELLRGAEQELVSLMSREFQDNTRYRGSQNAVATTWIVSFNQIRKADSAAADLLSFISCVEPKAIPRSLLPRFESEEEREHAIGTLSAYAFLVHRGDSDIYDMHSLVHLATRIWIGREGGMEEITMKALQHIEEVFPSADRVNRQLWQDYLPHALRLLDRSEGYRVVKRFDLFFCVGKCLYTDRRFKDAVGCFEEVSQWRAARLSDQDDDRLSADSWLASAYLDDRRIKDAIRMLEHVVEVQKKMLEEDDQERLTSEHELASAYLDDRRIKDAIKMLEHVVEVRKKTLEEDDYKRLASEHELARAYLDDRRIKDAVTMLEHVVEVEKMLEEEDYSRLASERMLARAYLDDKRIKDAIKILEHVVEVVKKTLEEDDHSRLASEHMLASAYLNDRRIKDAITMLEHVVEVRKKTLEEHDHERLTSEHELARAYLNDKRIKDAITMLEHVVEVRKKTLEEDDHERLTSEHELARAYLNDRRINDAIKILEHVVEVEKKTLDEEDHDRLASERTLATAYLDDGQAQKAVDLLEHVVTVESQLFEKDDPERHVSLDLLRDAYEQLEAEWETSEAESDGSE